MKGKFTSNILIHKHHIQKYISISKCALFSVFIDSVAVVCEYPNISSSAGFSGTAF